MNPLVSVIIPVFNGEKYLSEAIQSVLDQTYQPFEVIVVDDGSTDCSAEIALSFSGVVYIYQDNAGTASARNRGLRDAQGEYLAFLDADDLWLPDKIAVQMDALLNDSSLDIVTGQVQQRNEYNKSSQLTPPQIRPGYSPIAMLVRRRVFDRLGPFHDDWRVGEFISWFAKAKELGFKMEILPDLVAVRRIHGENRSLKLKDQKNKATLRILRASLDRRRSSSRRGRTRRGKD